jgi:hypothetical protein
MVEETGGRAVPSLRLVFLLAVLPYGAPSRFPNICTHPHRSLADIGIAPHRRLLYHGSQLDLFDEDGPWHTSI